MPLETAVVGAGVVSDLHLSALDGCPRTRLVGICDVDAVRARSAANRYGIDAYTDLSALLDDRDLDWVHLCTPVKTHLPLARELVQAGVAVHVEKPVTETVEEAEELERIAEGHGVPVSVTHQHLFDPAMRAARQRVDGGELGAVRAADLVYTGETWPDSANRDEWAFELTGGEFEEGLPHPLYLLLDAVDHPAGVEDVQVTTARHREYDRGFAYDGVHLSYRGVTGALCSVTCLAASAPQKLLTVHGEDRSLTVDLVSQTVIDVRADFDGTPVAKVRNNVSRSLDRLRGTVRNVYLVANDRLFGDWETRRNLDSHCYQTDVEAEALLQGDDPVVPVEQGRRTIELMECIREASLSTAPDRIEA